MHSGLAARRNSLVFAKPKKENRIRRMAAVVQTSRIIDTSCEPHPRLWTREEYYKMAEVGVFQPGDRVELVGGKVITMVPQDSPHYTAIDLTAAELRRIFAIGYVVRIQGPLDLGLISQPEPDVAVVRGTIRDYAKAHPNSALLVIEVAESSLTYDRGIKASLYASSGIPEYWVLNLVDRRLEVSHDPIAMPGQPHGYGYRTCTQYLATDTVTPLATPQGSIAVADLLP
jgi:Uma2 family endonuclease